MDLKIEILRVKLSIATDANVATLLSNTYLIMSTLLCFHWTPDLSFFYLIFPYLNPFLLSPADYIGLPRSYPLSLITPIINHPLYYLVAVCLLPYQCHVCYLVWYVDPQSSGTVGLGLCPLCSLTLLAQSRLAVYINCTSIPLGL